MAKVKRGRASRLGLLGLAAMILLSGTSLGASMAVHSLSRFAPIPSGLMLVFPLLVGLALGVLTRGLAQALGAFLLVIGVYFAADFLALSLPELIYAHLGREIVTQLSVARALVDGFIYVLPLTLIGLLVGKLVIKGD